MVDSSLRLLLPRIGVAVPDHAVAADTDTAVDRFVAATGARSRTVRLSGKWWRNDHGPLIVRRADGELAGLQPRAGGYRMLTVDHRSQVASTPLTASVAATIDPVAWSVYPALTSRSTTPVGVARSLLPRLRVGAPSLLLSVVAAAMIAAAIPLAGAQIIDRVLPARDRASLVEITVVLTLAAILMFVLRVYQARARAVMGGWIGVHSEAGVWNHILRLPVRFFRGRTSGDLEERLAGFDSARQTTVAAVLSAATSLPFVIAYGVTMAVLAPSLAAFAVGTSIVNVVILTLLGNAEIRSLREQRRASGDVASLVFQLLQGVVKIKSAGADRRALERWRTVYRRERHALRRVRLLGNARAAIGAAWPTLVLVGFVAIAGAARAGDRPDAGRYVAFLAAFASFNATIATMTAAIVAARSTVADLERIAPVLDAEPEARSGLVDPGRLSGAIGLEHVSFAYDAEAGPVVDDVSLTVPPGHHVAIVGASGSGKSTLLRLLFGFESPGAGTVRYDGHDLATLDPVATRRQFGVVLQSGRVFAGSILDNIRGAHDASLAACEHAAGLAALTDDLAVFPMGLHTILTEGGGTLSGGQRQRILLARALVGDPVVLFLDEATSALDNRTQAEVVANLDRLGITRIVIAHRLSTVRTADRIVVMDRGRIVETGTHDELLARDGHFARLAARQTFDTDPGRTRTDQP